MQGPFISFDNTALRVLSYYIIFFPSLDVVSVYPLLVLTIVNNMYTVVFGKDSSQAPSTWATFFIRLLMKFVAAFGPIVVAMGVSNLVLVLNYAGLMGFFICYFFPIVLQLRSQWVCGETFAEVFHRRRGSDYSSQSSDEDPINTEAAESHPLLPTWKKKDSLIHNRDLYMTPYSTNLSYWPAVVIIGGVGMVVFVLTVISLFVPLFNNSTVANTTVV